MGIKNRMATSVEPRKPQIMLIIQRELFLLNSAGPLIGFSYGVECSSGDGRIDPLQNNFIHSVASARAVQDHFWGD